MLHKNELRDYRVF